MKYILKPITFSLIFAYSHLTIYAQKQVNSEKELQSAIGSEVLKHNDTIAKYIKNKGVMFLRFLLKKDGSVDSVKCSEKQPKKLINVLTETLSSLKFPASELNDNSRYYVLPILFDYIPEFKEPNTIEELREQVPIIDLNDINSYINVDFNGLFKVNESEKTLWGINCVLLPTVKVGLARVYYHNNTGTGNDGKVKDKKNITPKVTLPSPITKE